jgi:hypothetical protein
MNDGKHDGLSDEQLLRYSRHILLDESASRASRGCSKPTPW